MFKLNLRKTQVNRKFKNIDKHKLFIKNIYNTYANKRIKVDFNCVSY